MHVHMYVRLVWCKATLPLLSKNYELFINTRNQKWNEMGDWIPQQFHDLYTKKHRGCIGWSIDNAAVEHEFNEVRLLLTKNFQKPITDISDSKSGRKSSKDAKLCSGGWWT